jgi:serine/threonine-protein kinase
MSNGEATLVGRTIGSYRVTAEIGRGGMGAVYLAEHPLIGRKVAIKVLLSDVSRDADNVGRFFNEARAAASIRHPALVDVFDFGTLPEGSAYLVMDYLEGDTLAGRLAERKRLPAEMAVAITRQVASGMAIAHAKGIIHRDLKPENIFLMADGGAAVPTVKILDFGIAKLTGTESELSHQRTRTGILMGTPLYMSPEQCRGAGAVDTRTDIYSLGCIVYAMLTGGPPFVREGVGELIGAHLFEAPRAPRDLEPSVPAALEAVVLRMLAKRPEDRQQSMLDLERELERVDLQQRTPSLPSTPPAASALGRTAPMVSVAGGRDTGARAPVAPTAARNSEAREADTLDAGAVARTTPGPARRRLAPAVALGAGAIVAIGLVFALRRPDSVTASAPSAAAVAPATTAPPTEVAPPVPAPPVVAPPVVAPPVVAPPVVAPPVVAPPVVAPPVAVKAAPVPPPPVEKVVPVAAAQNAVPAPRTAVAMVAREQVRITASNARTGAVVRVDGRKISLPLKLPKDGKSHTFTFETPSFEPETVEVRATRDRNITLKNRPFLLMQ